ncbi:MULTISPECIES: SMP-30/gluconolactonase/LRE family protein [unclassified Sphingobium]|uniref:SMP-30/gluconolactonase/LRE family protein n=1 Tax=unclassified Sphingobium TaxID=2611147 RepID=UPI00222577D3|nr:MULTISPECIES: SMP-30/gluconolactonase/LRE family protein [unclassified Sphingobium]MCW2383913.1 sugar lactone lactonase YvrE [Sphingobium sp. B2D3D]
MQPEPILPLGMTLGEGPVWWDDALWFVDIKGHRLYRHVPTTGALAVWDAPDQIGWALPTRSGDMMTGVRTGLHRFDPQSGTFSLFHDPEPHLPGNRLNDAATDTQGRLWFGSMDDSEAAQTGCLYCLAGGQCAATVVPAVEITNGPAISADGRTLYHTDTLGRKIWKVPVDENGTVGAGELFITIENGAGWPDGSVLDSEGCLWVALFGGWGVRRYDPQGRLMQTISFPVANVTKIAFGGPDLRTAYATTAHKGLDAAAREAQPLAGHVFAFDPKVAGLPVTPADI